MVNIIAMFTNGVKYDYNYTDCFFCSKKKISKEGEGKVQITLLKLNKLVVCFRGGHACLY